MASQTKINQIKAELQNQGIEPTEQAIKAVLEVLGTGKTISVVDAIKQLIASQQSSHNPDQLLIDMSLHLSNQQVNFVANTAINLTMTRILSGDFGELNTETKQKIEDFKNKMQEVKVLDENFFKSALPSSRQNLLPTSEQVFDAEVAPEPITQS